jgi:hypothetical protein
MTRNLLKSQYILKFKHSSASAAKIILIISPNTHHPQLIVVGCRVIAGLRSLNGLRKKQLKQRKIKEQKEKEKRKANRGGTSELPLVRAQELPPTTSPEKAWANHRLGEGEGDWRRGRRTRSKSNKIREEQI